MFKYLIEVLTVRLVFREFYKIAEHETSPDSEHSCLAVCEVVEHFGRAQPHISQLGEPKGKVAKQAQSWQTVFMFLYPLLFANFG